MCFINDIKTLNALRARKRPITVWKRAALDGKTGTLKTSYGGRWGTNDQVVWVKGTVVYPHKKLKPLTDLQLASAGLYFYLNERQASGHPLQNIIKARVQPKDIIGASRDGTICTTAAYVIRALDPDIRKTRIKWLKDILHDANCAIEKSDAETKLWAAKRDEQLECRQTIRDELRELKKGKK